MNLAIYLVAALLVVTKLFDVVSTLKNIRHACREANPWLSSFGLSVTSAAE